MTCSEADNLSGSSACKKQRAYLTEQGKMQERSRKEPEGRYCVGKPCDIAGADRFGQPDKGQEDGDPPVPGIPCGKSGNQRQHGKQD